MGGISFIDPYFYTNILISSLNLILFLNIDIPENALVFFRALLPANFIKLDYIIYFLPDNFGYVENEAIPYSFKEEELTTEFFRNAFFTLLFYAFMIGVYLLIKIFSKVLVAPLREKKKCSWLGNLVGHLEDLMEYSALLRMALITFIPLTLSALLQILNLEFSSKGNIISSVLALLTLVYVFIFFLFTVIFLNSSSIDLEDPEIDKKYLPLFDLLKKKAFFKRNFTIFYMLRKFFWIISVIFLDASLLDQIFLLIFWALFITTFMYFKKPYLIDKLNLLNLFTELMLLVMLLLIGSIQCLTDLKENLLSVDSKLIIGWVILSIGILLVCVKALSLIVEILINIKSLVLNTKIFFKTINNDDKMSISAEGDNLIDSKYRIDGDVHAIKEEEEEDDYEEEKERENAKL